MEQLKQNTRISFDIDGKIKGVGKIVGVTTSEMPMLGYQYIIEPDEPINNEVYEYSHFVAWSTMIKEL
jgi:hypothetical protein